MLSFWIRQLSPVDLVQFEALMLALNQVAKSAGTSM
jgi:hypothetical protein